MSGWRLIDDNSPKDGTKIDLWAVDENGVGERLTDSYWGSFRRMLECWMARDFHPVDYGSYGPVEFSFQEFSPLGAKTGWVVTHWMPIPSPPQSLTKRS